MRKITTMLQACARRKVEGEWGDELVTSPMQVGLVEVIEGERLCMSLDG